jgi:hypothetical protein
MRAKILCLALAMGAFFVCAACDEPKESPAAPTQPAAPAPPTAVAITIGGRLSIGALGETTQLTATARLSSGTTQEVTSQAQWQCMAGVLTVISPGLVKAERYGWDTISAAYDGRIAHALVRAAPDGVFLVAGFISTDVDWAARAKVQATSRAGTFTATADGYGFYFVPAAGETTLQIELEGFRPLTRSITVNQDQNVDLVLQRSEAAGPDGT